ncbi:MAG: alpha-ketoglutarate-dependent dioxygenase AlkB, partial [Pseudomonadota bacterium]|nr:alpha-ketoglutarate-dependent dioxygenase AlkB [Pseudomonadota bacterium]
RGETQRHYRHSLPRTVKPLGPRINLTFRRVMFSQSPV